MPSLKRLPTEALYNRHALQLTPEVRELLKDLMRFLNDRDIDLIGLLDRGLLIADNFNGAMLEYTSNATPDTQDSVAHGLKRVPTDFIVVNRDKGAVVYKSAAFDSTNLYLKATVASTTVRLFAF